MPIGQLTFQPYVNPYVALPTKEYGDLQEQLRGQYDDTAAIYDYLDEASKGMKALDIDNPLKEKILQETQDRIRIAAEKGNYEDLGRIARREAKDFATKYRPVAEELKKVQDYQKSQKELFEKGLIDKTQYELAMNESLGRYKGIEAGDSFVGHTNAKKIDVAEKMSKMFDHYNADAQQTNSDYRITENGMLKNIKTGVEQVLTADVYKNLVQYANTDPEINEYLNDLIYLKTYHLSDDEVKNQINDSFTSIYNSSKLKPEDKQKLASQFQQIINASPQEQRAYIQNTLKQNTISQFAQPIAEREGYTKITQDIDMKALPDAILNKIIEQNSPKGESYDTEVFKNNFFNDYEELDYTPDFKSIDTKVEETNKKLMIGLDEFAKELGLRQADATNGGYNNYIDNNGKIYTSDEINNKFKNTELYKKGQTKLQILQKEREAIKNAKPLERINILSENNSMLADIKDTFNKEWEEGKIKGINPSKSEEKQKADIILKRYNSKLNSLKNNNVDQYYIPSNNYLETKQKQYFGGEGKEGIIKDRLLFSEKSGKMENFNTWLKQNNINRDDFFKKGKIVGLSSGKYEGDLYVSYKGKSIPVTGSKEMTAFRKPLHEIWKVVSENKHEINNLDLEKILPGVKVNVIGKDYYNENNEHEGREPLITISSSSNPKFQTNIGETYTWTEFMKLVDKVEAASLEIK